MASEPFVKRLFVVDGHEVECRFAQPEMDGADSVCRFEIDWPEGPKSVVIYGVDGVQALSLAMQTAHVYLLAARDRHGRVVTWLDGADLGLPVPPPHPDT
ncbi:MAG: hypothetical protein J0I42_23625 [Bosea sp.]|uniref:DUF6968 family protein n=1 Tax=Bosea sp. (in: a-proteobacteria) TaxID=1871050 RepID=UPI001AC69413|nr:hypothetical protein [Bosea sp. (in: a-proteobacteria)]MBN9454942.1 hypothetical protein [Bosea sp. (in: a-proteobacteria)]